MRNYSKNQLKRYPIYLKYFKELEAQGEETVSSPKIAKVLGYSEEQIRKDLQAVSNIPGRPKKGRNIAKLIDTLETFLGYKGDIKAVIIGCGHLGQALLHYPNFDQMGLSIVCGFDVDQSLIGKNVDGKEIFDLRNLKEKLTECGAKIAIITVPVNYAQGVADEAIAAGAKGLWNFAPTHLNAPSNIVIENFNFSSSLAVLMHDLAEKGN